MPLKTTQGRIWKGVRSFFSFWKHFLIGDSPILALGVLVNLAVDFLLRNFGLLAPVLSVTMVLVLLAIAVYQKTRRKNSY
jgi:undecaprenyl pyrophosphate phosphatase UppP